MERDELIEAVAKLACAAYWRGRMEAHGLQSPTAIKDIVEILTRHTWQEWEVQAKTLLKLDQ